MGAAGDILRWAGVTGELSPKARESGSYFINLVRLVVLVYMIDSDRQDQNGLEKGTKLCMEIARVTKVPRTRSTSIHYLYRVVACRY